MCNPLHALGHIGDMIRELLPNAYVFNASQLPLSSGNDFAIGIVIQPGPQTLLQKAKYLVTYPMSFANYWGHTGIYVRSEGRIVRAVGYDPDRLRMFSVGLLTGETMGVETGRRGTRGFIYDENVMFRSPDVICVEFRVSRKLTELVLRNLPLPGRSERGLREYVTRGGSRLQVQPPVLYGNCIDFVQRVLKAAHLRITVIQGPEFGSAQGHLTVAALRNNLRLQTFGGKSNKKIAAQGEILQMSGFFTISRRIGGALRSLSFTSGLFRIAGRAIGVTDPVAWVMEIVCGVVERLLGLFGYSYRFPDFFFSQTLFFVVLLLDFFIETATFRRLRRPAQILSGVLTAGAVLAWVAALTGNEASMIQMLMSYMTIVHVSIA